MIYPAFDSLTDTFDNLVGDYSAYFYWDSTDYDNDFYSLFSVSAYDISVSSSSISVELVYSGISYNDLYLPSVSDLALGPFYGYSIYGHDFYVLSDFLGTDCVTFLAFNNSFFDKFASHYLKPVIEFNFMAGSPLEIAECSTLAPDGSTFWGDSVPLVSYDYFYFPSFILQSQLYERSSLNQYCLQSAISVSFANVEDNYYELQSFLFGIPDNTSLDVYSSGFEDGYQEGLYDGSHFGGFTGPFSVIGQAFSSVVSASNTEVFPGLTIGNIVLIPICIAIITTLVKSIRG